MKLSQYTVFVRDFPIEGKCLVYNIRNGATVVVSERTLALLTEVGSFNSSHPRINKFVELGLVVEDSLDEASQFRAAYEKERYSSTSLSATILTTFDCNFACEYCIEDGVKGPVKMSTAVCDATVAWLMRKMDRCKSDSIQLQFYGGEPLMNTAPIYHIASRFHERFEKSDKAYGFNITTNGSLLKSTILEELVPLGLSSVRVTLDGDRAAHNRKRPYKNGKGSFDTIVKNVLQIVDIPGVRVTVGVNIDNENLESVPRLLDYLEEVDLRDKVTILFGPIERSSKESSRDCSSVSEWVVPGMLPLTLEAYIRGFNISEQLTGAICGINRDGTSVTIDPLGNIYTCPAFVGRDVFQMGDVYHSELNTVHTEVMNIEFPDECWQCTYMPICSGGCRHTAYNTYGDISIPTCIKEYLHDLVIILLKMQFLSRTGTREELTARRHELSLPSLRT